MADGTLKVGTITTSSGSGTITLGQSGETVSVPKGVMSGQIYPAFSSYINAASFQWAGSTWTKLQMYGEDYDTDSAYDTSNGKFTIPTGAAGKYNFELSCRSINEHTMRLIIAIYKNGSAYAQQEHRWSMGSGTTFNCANLVVSIDCAAGDYFEAYGYHTSGAGSGILGSASATDPRESWWSAYRIGA